MANTVAESKGLAQADANAKSVLECPAQELVLYRLRCAQTANGLSHYYMWGDVAPEDTLL